MERKYLLIGAVVLLICLVGGCYLYNTPERRISRRVEKLARLLEKKPNEKSLDSLLTAKSAADFFAAEPVIALANPFPRPSDRRELAAQIHQIRNAATAVTIEILDQKIQVGADGQTATMTIKAEAVFQNGEEVYRDLRDLNVRWEKTDGEWLIKSVTGEDTLDQPAGS